MSSYLSSAAVCFSVLLYVLIIPAEAGESEWVPSVAYVQRGLGKDRLSDNNSILLMPLINEKLFDTSKALRPQRIIDLYLKPQRKAGACFKEDFEERFIAKYKKNVSWQFYKHLLNGEILSLAKDDSAWSVMPCRYVFLLRITKGMRIQSFEGVTKRKAVLEGEMWDSRTAEIVWRGQVTGSSVNVKISDSDFIIEGIIRLFRQLPEFYQVRNEENW